MAARGDSPAKTLGGQECSNTPTFRQYDGKLVPAHADQHVPVAGGAIDTTEFLAIKRRIRSSLAL